MKNIEGKVRAAVERYDMIKDGDRIAVGLSGGKDSTALLYALSKLRSYYPKKFDLTAISVDMRFGGADTDFSPITEFCESLGVEHIIKRTDLSELIFNVRKESNPCSLCSKMRRGVLNNIALQNNSNKVALGHHKDDAAETFLMNLLNGGTIGCFSPVTYLSDKGVFVIRPLLLLSESDIAGAVKSLNLPVVKTLCPKDGFSERQNVKNLIKELNKTYPGVREKITGALRRKGIDGW